MVATNDYYIDRQKDEEKILRKGDYAIEEIAH